MKEKIYKVTDGNGNACHGGTYKWPLPVKKEDGTWTPGEWTEQIIGELVPCKNGYHLCRATDLLSWLDESIYEAEYEGDIVEDVDKVVVRKARLLKECEGWNDRTARLFACWCVRNTPLLGKEGKTVWNLLTDDRSKQAVEVAERYANLKATRTELVKARAVAGDAAWDAAEAAGDAAAAAAKAAAEAVAEAAAKAAKAAAEAVAEAAGDAAEAAAKAAAWDAAEAAARVTQTRQLLKIIVDQEEVMENDGP